MKIVFARTDLPTRWIFRAYGWLLIGLGIVGLDGNAGRSIGARLQPADLVLHPNPATPFGAYIVPRMAGAVLVLVGMLALAFGNLQDAEARRRSLSRFAIAHVLFGFFYSGVAEALMSPIVPAWLVWSPLAAGLVIGFFALLQRPDTRHGASLEALRSQYETQIREAARREERTRLARDLHDAVKQQLFAIQTNAAAVEARLETDQTAALGAARAARAGAHEALVEMDALIDQLQAAPMENTGLVGALRKQCEALRFQTGADVQLTVGELPPSAALVPGTQEGLYRFAQEALANIARHARATHVTVRLAASAGRIEVSIADDGIGFDRDVETVGMGRRNMAARAVELGGECVIESAPGSGTRASCAIPCASASPPRIVRTSIWVAVSGVAGFLLYTCGGQNDQGAPPYLLGLLFLRVFGIALAIAVALAALWHVSRLRARVAG
jgi:signal transduction histidine kinase